MAERKSQAFLLYVEGGDHMKDMPDIGQISFPEIVEQPVMWGYYRDLHQADKYKALVDPNTRKVFCVVSKEYRLIRHEEAIERIEEAIYEVPELSKYETYTNFYNDGGRMRRTYRFPEISVEIEQGDPVNLVIIGKGKDLHRALLRSNWNETAAVSQSKTQSSAFFPWQFRYAPVLPLYLYGRHQDAAFRKSRSTVNERNQLRLWLSPMMINGKNVWIGQISRIIRRLSVQKFKIEPNVDEVRTYILQDLWYSQALSKYAYVKGVDEVPISEPRKSINNDPYFTDGYRLVLWVSGDPVSFSKVEFVPWERPRSKK